MLTLEVLLPLDLSVFWSGCWMNVPLHRPIVSGCPRLTMQEISVLFNPHQSHFVNLFVNADLSILVPAKRSFAISCTFLFLLSSLSLLFFFKSF
ncbi:hypothetical protein GDO78_019587 [Eleutherodactylus coqui]|uniref:Uncharacterized protein n=1 Tax=Eleutherodactylus coqui TaxID=57060 RepID=A0A8J6BIR7_ELECQ|nr:hypothetical protein GDO78_019587 [Eleutherodactylus coqui]